MSDTTRLAWAIAGTGTIARRFAEDMRVSQAGHVVAVASADPERATRFAASIGVDVAHGDLDAILARSDVDAVYVAGRNELHCEHALRCLAAGKPVLVEKPFATSASEAGRMVEAAATAGLLLMEAMWMHFIPAMLELRTRVRRGDLGALRTLDASLHFANPAPAASPLLDLGVYPTSLAVQLFGSPSAIAATSAANGRQSALLLTYPDAIASLSCGFSAEGANDATLVGTKGVLQTNRPFLSPTMLSFRRTKTPNPTTETEQPSARPGLPFRQAARSLFGQLRTGRTPILFRGNGLHYQADHFAKCLRDGRTDSPIMPLRESVEVVRIIAEAERLVRGHSSSGNGSKLDEGV